MESNDTARSALLEQCSNLAEQKSLLDAISQELKKTEFVGEPRIPYLIWLASLTGRNRDLGKKSRPVSVLLKGPSGAGKSFSLHAGLAFVPKEEYAAFSGMSEKALVYEKELDLRHKHLVIGEAAGLKSGDGSAFLRQLVSEGEINYSSTMKDSKGQMSAQKLHVEGPTGVLMTTTANKLHHEDESRMLSVNVPDSREQRREALMSVALGSRKTHELVDYNAWHAFHRYITSGDQEVEVPYASRLVDYLPLHHDRIKRDFYQVMALLEASALVHQFSRNRDDQGNVVASRSDYECIHYLLDEALSENLALTVSPAVRDVVEAFSVLRKGSILNDLQDTSTYEPVTIAELSEHLERDRSAVTRSVMKAIELEYLYDENPGKGRPSRLQLGEVALPTGSVLPHPEELFGLKEVPPAFAAE